MTSASPSLNIWIPTYDDLAHLEEALDSIIDCNDDLAAADWQVYVVDGRYRTFEGDTDLTDGAEALCERYGRVTYTHPTRATLPLGDPDLPAHLRAPQHAQATWVNYHLLPSDEWALEMDTDERLEHIDPEALADLNPRRKYTATVLTPDDDQLWPTIRLYQPQYWTFWIDDVMFWRQFYPREDTTTADLFEAHSTTSHGTTGYGGETDAVILRNYGSDRPDDYRERRAQQLETMGTPWVADAVRDGDYPSLIDWDKEVCEGCGHVVKAGHAPDCPNNDTEVEG